MSGNSNKDIEFFKQHYESPEQWAEEIIRAHSFHSPISEKYLKQLQKCKSWEDVIRLSKDIVPFLER